MSALIKKITFITLLGCTLISCTQSNFDQLKNIQNVVGAVSGVNSVGSQSTGNQNSNNDVVSSGISTLLMYSKDDTLEEELAVGKIFAAQILGASKLHADLKLQNYVNKVGRHVASQSERANLPWTFGVINTSSINAFSAPGGYVLITKGLFDLLQTEDELASVLGHEIAHVCRKHYYNVVKKQKLIEFGTKVGASASGIGQSDQLINMLQGIVGKVMARGLDKSSEYEADRDGMVLAARAGYDASALANVLEILEAKGKADSTMALLFATHPAPDDRITELVSVITPELDLDAVPSAAKDRILVFKK